MRFEGPRVTGFFKLQTSNSRLLCAETEDSVGEEQLPVRPEAAEERVVDEVDDRAGPDLFDAEHKRVDEALADAPAGEARRRRGVAKRADVPAGRQ